MAVKNLQALVLRVVAVNGNVGTSMKRIGSTAAAGQTSASRYPICDATPGYPPVGNQPKPGHLHDDMDDAFGRAGRSGSSWQGGLRSRGSASSARTAVLSRRTGLVEQLQLGLRLGEVERGRPSAEVSRIHLQAQDRLQAIPRTTAVAAQFGRLAGTFTTSTRGESIG